VATSEAFGNVTSALKFGALAVADGPNHELAG
jgi:hypothetical protein